LKPSDYESYREELWLRRHENTCTWVLDDWRYKTWAEKNDKTILWISGHPGCGKSVLSSFLTKEITRGKTNRLSMVYFFCDDKDERLRTAHAILVNLLAQLLMLVPDVIVHFLAEYEFFTKKEKASWSFGMLWRVFERIINGAHRGQLYILIDALGIFSPPDIRCSLHP
jgi:Cdc6-like AAA superfamily ATPase